MWNTTISLLETVLGLLKALAIGLLVYCVYTKLHYTTGAYYRCTKRPRNQLNSKSGTRGECETYEALRKLERKGWKFLFGLHIPKVAGGTTEIDIVAIGPQGIFCIESKDYSGDISGREDAKDWLQIKPYLKNPEERVKKFYNPLMQNAGHVANLKRLIENMLPSATFFSLVVFSDRCNLCVPRATEYCTEITQVKNVLETFTRMAQNGCKISRKDISKIYAEFKTYMRPNIFEKKKLSTPLGL